MQGVSRRRRHRSSNPFFDETLKTSLNQRTCFRPARLDSRPSGLAGEDRTTATSALQSIGKTKATLEGRRIGMLVDDGSDAGAVQARGRNRPEGDCRLPNANDGSHFQSGPFHRFE